MRRSSDDAYGRGRQLLAPCAFLATSRKETQRLPSAASAHRHASPASRNSLLAVPDLGTHAAFLPTYFAPTFALPHALNQPFANEVIIPPWAVRFCPGRPNCSCERRWSRCRLV